MFSLLVSEFKTMLKFGKCANQNVLELTRNPPMRINHLESVLYSQMKDYREKEDLEVNRWKVLYSLEDFLVLALNY